MMKQILLMLLSFIVIHSFAQKSVKGTIRVPGVSCEECAAIIQNALWKRVDGLTAIEVRWKSKTVNVSYVPDRVDLDDISSYIRDLGFDTDDEKGDSVFMKRLPACCRRVEVGKPKTQVVAVTPVTPVVPVKAVLKDSISPKAVKKKTPVPVKKKSL
jgi:copper chaperone CopZ